MYVRKTLRHATLKSQAIKTLIQAAGLFHFVKLLRQTARAGVMVSAGVVLYMYYVCIIIMRTLLFKAF